ncbi:MAG: excisionase family DNA-binding protein [Actinomycetota bacterium]
MKPASDGGKRMQQLLSVEEAAEYSGFSVRYLRRLIFERRIAYHKDRRRVWLLAGDLDAYVRGLRVEPYEEGALPGAGHLRLARRS